MNNNVLIIGIIKGVVISAFFFATVASSTVYVNQNLERRVGELERRVTQLENQLNSAPDRTVPASISSWRQLKNNMTMDQVRSVLGEPDRVHSITPIVTWYYGTGTVSFNNNRVSGWSEPRR